MEQNIQLPLNPDMERIYKYFPYLFDVDEATKIKMAASWSRIDPSDYEFLKEMFLSRKVKVRLDDIAYLYNYLLFIQRVNGSEFNITGSDIEKAEKELRSFFQLMQKKKAFKRISIVWKQDSNIKEEQTSVKIISDYALKFFQLILERNLNEFVGTQYVQNHLLEMQTNGSLGGLLKKRPGNKIEYTDSVMRQAVTLLKNYFKGEAIVSGKKRVSYNIFIAKILIRIGYLEDFKDDGHYNDEEDYYNKKVEALNLDTMIPKTPKIIDDLFPPHTFIMLNRTLI